MASFPAARTSFHCQATGAAAMTTHNAAVCVFVRLANRESNAAKPSRVGGVNCVAACVTAAATAAGGGAGFCCNDAAGGGAGPGFYSRTGGAVWGERGEIGGGRGC